jgi:hypothetical protein
MTRRTALWGAAGLVALLSVAALATGVVRGRASFERLEARARAAGVRVDAGAVERGMFEDTLRDVRATFAGGAVARANTATLSGSPLRRPSLHVPALEVTLTGDPLEAYERVGRVTVPEGVEAVATRVAVRYEHRALGTLALGGVSASASPPSVRAEVLELGGARFSDVTFSLAKKRGTLEVALGAERDAGPRATATYVPSDGRAAEWRIVVPHQALGALRGALGLGGPPLEDAPRMGGTLSFVVPDDANLPRRGSFRFVVDAWPRPAWPDASALTGASGAIAAVVVPSSSAAELRLERVEVAAALFELRGSGTIALGAAPKLTLVAAGRRTCAELAQGLPASRHRDAVRAYLAVAPGPAPRGQTPETPRAGEWAELSLRLELAFGPEGGVRFLWHLSAGCGLAEMAAERAGGG